MQIRKMQTETTWHVELDGQSWTVTRLEDFDSLTFSWEVWDDDGEEYTGPALIRILAALELE